VVNATLNPRLNCIEIDDSNGVSSSWFKNLETEFSINCCTYIDDPNFEKILIELGYDEGPIDGKVLSADIENVRFLDVSRKNLTNLKGIEGFISIEVLY
jgi:hypothetical protein